jgi:diguanylate cyclase (GGDEF)-like protein
MDLRSSAAAGLATPALRLWDAVQDALLLATPAGSLVFANATARAWLGCEAEPAGLTVVDLLRRHAADPADFDSILHDAARLGGMRSKVFLRLASDIPRPVRLRGMPWQDRDGSAFLLFQLADITEAVREAEERGRSDRTSLLIDLLGTTIGDLEYPLGALRWCASVPEDEFLRLPEDLQRPFRAVRQAARHFSDLFASLDLRGASDPAAEIRRPLRLLALGGGPADSARLVERLRAEGMICACRPVRSREELMRAALADEADAVLLLAGLSEPSLAGWTEALTSVAPRLPVFDAAGVALPTLSQALREAVEKNRRVGAAEEVWRRIEEIALRDPLTGVLNRRAFERFATQEFARAQRYAFPLALALFDLDHFKEVNDTLGHPAGDRLLQRFASFLQNSTRQSDFVARLGGDEFALLMTHTDADGALTLVQRLREELESHVRDGLPPLVRQVGVSVGLAMHPAPQVQSFAALTDAADAALYRAKRSGRGRVGPAEAAAHP